MHTQAHDGTAIYYEVHGDGDEAVLLLMGLGAAANVWEPQIEPLSRRYRVIRLDNRGVGRSGKPAGPYTTAQMARDALHVMDITGTASAHVVGISMGGMIAQEMALLAPQRVRTLVLAATYARPDPATGDAVGQAVAQVKARRGLGASPVTLDPGAMPEDLQDALATMMAFVELAFSEDFLRREQAQVAAMMAESAQFGFHPAGFFAQLAATASHDTTARLPALRPRTLVITGTKDRLIPPHCSTELHQLIPSSRLHLLDGAGHTLNIEDNVAFTRAVMDFIAEV